jgi:hypothetical protein
MDFDPETRPTKNALKVSKVSSSRNDDPSSGRTLSASPNVTAADRDAAQRIRSRTTLQGNDFA